MMPRAFFLGALVIVFGCTEEESAPPAPSGCDPAAPRSSAVVDVACNSGHTCAALADGRVRCWGENGEGQLGDGTHWGSPEPTEVLELCGAVAVDVGFEFSCARMSSGRVKCWGRNDGGQLGDGDGWSKARPVDVLDAEGVLHLDSGNAASVVFTASDTILRWGYWDDWARQRLTGAAHAVAVAGVDGAIAVAQGGNHTCVIMADQTVKCWGENFEGQLGSPTRLIGSDTPIAVPGLTGVAELSLGGGFSCALLGDGRVSCWGWTKNGHVEATGPALVPGLEHVRHVEAGALNACAILEDGTGACWNGENPPRPIEGLADIVELAVGDYYLCARTGDGALYCWGENTFGELGLGDHVGREVPTRVPLD